MRTLIAAVLLPALASILASAVLAAPADAVELTRQIWERALPNDEITPGVTALEDVA